VEPIYVYIDESGDIGCPRGSSFFSIAALITWNRKRIERIPSQIRRRRLRKSLLQKSELKFHNCDKRVRRTTLSMLMKQDDSIISAIVIKKKGAAKRLEKDGRGFFDDCCLKLIEEVVRSNFRGREIILVFDSRWKSKALESVFDLRIHAIVKNELRILGGPAPSIRISRFDSQNSRGLQMVDFVAGAIQRKYEHDDPTYYDIISERIVSEEKRFFD
jgi:hypothetical protein